MEEALEIWREYFNVSDRVEYLREKYVESGAHDLCELKKIVRGDYLPLDYQDILR